MAGDWIKMRADLHTHPKVVRMASALKADRLRIVGGLHSAWCLFDVHSVDGLLDGYSAETLDDLIGFHGFSRAMIAVGWLEENGESLVMPRFEAHNGQSAKRRAQDADRKRNVRKASASDADKKRTREEKRREDIKDQTPHIGEDENHPVDNSDGDNEPDPAANNIALNDYAPPGGSGAFGKFTLPDGWKPDPDFVRRAALWGINLKTDVTPFELADFITYWKAEGKAFHHDQWQQKLARSVQASRARPSPQQRRDVNALSEPDSEIPEGFRG